MIDVPGLLYGGDYNPEQWPEDVWVEDARLMREAGVNLVSLGVFAWARLQPGRDRWDFGWLDRLMDLLADHGVSVNLGTATASPPQWLVAAHPEILPVDPGGKQAPRNSTRMHFCPSSPVFREHQARLVERLARRYHGHRALRMWHVANEYYAFCSCPVSVDHFRRWLQARYPSLDALNEAWGTSVWNQTFTDWEQVQAAPDRSNERNLGQALDWLRFTSDAMLESFDLEADILRRLSPGVPVSNNWFGTALSPTPEWEYRAPLDYWRWAPHVDLVASDVYPDPADPHGWHDGPMDYDLLRSVGAGRPWILTETATSAVNWRPVNQPKRPGQLRLWSYQAIAHGADGVMFFQWRQARASAEQFHSAMVPHGGRQTRTWREVADLGRELRRLGEVRGARTMADVAIVLDWESGWALELEGKPSDRLRQITALRDWYRVLHEASVAVDFVHPGVDLSAYCVVVVPNLYAMSTEVAAGFERYVRAGGTIVVGPFSGIADPSHRIHLGPYPGALRELLGLTIDDFWPVPDGVSFPVRMADGGVAMGDTWRDWIEPTTAEVMARYADGPLAELPVVTRRSHGAGWAWYVGTCFDDPGLAAVLGGVLEQAGVRPVGSAPLGVELVRRSNPEASFLFVLNHGGRRVTVQLDGVHGTDLVTGEVVDGTIEVDGLGVAVIREPRADA